MKFAGSKSHLAVIACVALCFVPSIVNAAFVYKHSTAASDCSSSSTVVTLTDGGCIANGAQSFKYSCQGAGQAVKFEFWNDTSSCAGTVHTTYNASTVSTCPSDSADSNGYRNYYSCDWTTLSGTWFLQALFPSSSSACGASDLSGAAIMWKSGECVPNDGAFIKHTCQSSGKFDEYEGCSNNQCNSGCTSSDTGLPQVQCVGFNSNKVVRRCVTDLSTSFTEYLNNPPAVPSPPSSPVTSPAGSAATLSTLAVLLLAATALVFVSW